MWALTIAGISVGAVIAGYFMLRKKGSDDLSKVAGDSWEVLKNWNGFMNGEFSTVGAYLSQFRLMHAIGETYLRIEDALASGRIDRTTAEKLHQGLIQKVLSIAGEKGEELIADSVALADYMRKNNIDVKSFGVGTVEEVYDNAKASAQESGLIDRVLSETERRIAKAEDLVMSNRNQSVMRR